MQGGGCGGDAGQLGEVSLFEGLEGGVFGRGGVGHEGVDPLDGRPVGQVEDGEVSARGVVIGAGEDRPCVRCGEVGAVLAVMVQGFRPGRGIDPRGEQSAALVVGVAAGERDLDAGLVDLGEQPQ